jgi:hypothetical protein
MNWSIRCIHILEFSSKIKVRRPHYLALLGPPPLTLYLQKSHGLEERLIAIGHRRLKSGERSIATRKAMDTVGLPYTGAGAPSGRRRGDIAASEHDDSTRAWLPHLAADEIRWRSTAATIPMVLRRLLHPPLHLGTIDRVKLYWWTPGHLMMECLRA